MRRANARSAAAQTHQPPMEDDEHRAPDSAPAPGEDGLNGPAAPAPTDAQTEAALSTPRHPLDRDGDGRPGGSLPGGRVLVTVRLDHAVHDGCGGYFPAGADIAVTDAQAETLRDSGLVR